MMHIPLGVITKLQSVLTDTANTVTAQIERKTGSMWAA